MNQLSLFTAFSFKDLISWVENCLLGGVGAELPGHKRRKARLRGSIFARRKKLIRRRGARCYLKFTFCKALRLKISIYCKYLKCDVSVWCQSFRASNFYIIQLAQFTIYIMFFIHMKKKINIWIEINCYSSLIQFWTPYYLILLIDEFKQT